MNSNVLLIPSNHRIKRLNVTQNLPEERHNISQVILRKLSMNFVATAYTSVMACDQLKINEPNLDSSTQGNEKTRHQSLLLKYQIEKEDE